MSPDDRLRFPDEAVRRSGEAEADEPDSSEASPSDARLDRFGVGVCGSGGNPSDSAEARSSATVGPSPSAREEEDTRPLESASGRIGDVLTGLPSLELSTAERDATEESDALLSDRDL